MTMVFDFIKKMFKNSRFQAVLFYFLMFCLVTAYSLINNVPDYDIWSRLIMGSHVINHGSVMYQDIISYTPTHTWFDHEWITSAIFYVVFDKFGYTGASILKIVLTCAVFALIGLNLSIYDKGYKFKLFYMAACIPIFALIEGYTNLRCESVSFIFYVVLIYIMEIFRRNYGSKLVYFLPFMFVVWLNMHGASVYGLMVIFFYGLDALINKKPFKKYFYILIPCALAYFITPWGVDFIKFTLDTPFIGRSYINEWLPLWSFPRPILIKTCISLFLVFLIYIFGIIQNKKNNIKFDWAAFFILLINFVLAIKHRKFHSFFLFTAYIFLYPYFKNLFELIIKYIKNTKLKNILGLACSGVLSLIIIVFSLNSIATHPLVSTWYANEFPEMPFVALQFIKDNNIKGNLFTEFQYSGLVAYKNYPDIKIYMDGRQEQVYDTRLAIKEMNFLKHYAKDPSKIVRKYNTEIILIRNFWEINNYLMNDQDYYVKIYSDEDYSIYVAKHLKKNKYVYPEETPDYTFSKLFIPSYKF